jgi:hypothetical protein
MPKRKSILFGVAVMAIGISFVTQHQNLQRLRAENQSFQAELQEAPQKNNQLSIPDKKQSSLSETQSSELLRLRNEVATLRRDQQELVRLRARQESETRQAPPPVIQQNEKFQASQEIALGALKQITQQFRLLMKSKNLKAAIGPDGRLDPAVISQKFPEFDLSQVELLVNDADQLGQVLNGAYGPDDIILARTRSPIPTADGKWIRYYALADGSARGRLTENPNHAFEGNWQLREIPP